MTSPDVTTQNVIDDLDSFYCHNIVASLWADAVANRLEGMAIYLLSDELPEVAEHARAAARRPTRGATGSRTVSGAGLVPRERPRRQPGDQTSMKNATGMTGGA